MVKVPSGFPFQSPASWPSPLSFALVTWDTFSVPLRQAAVKGVYPEIRRMNAAEPGNLRLEVY